MMKRQEEDDGRKSERIITFNREIEQKDHERIKTLNGEVQRMKRCLPTFTFLFFLFFCFKTKGKGVDGV